MVDVIQKTGSLTPESIIKELDLVPHPEGGFYKETYRCADEFEFQGNSSFQGKRSFSTAIYFLLCSGDFSAFHKIKSDELWHFYLGFPLSIYAIDQDGSLSETTLGVDLASGELPQMVVKAGKWFGAQLVHPNTFALVGCTVSPGFDFKDFELGKRDPLVNQFPQHENLIMRLTRR